MKFIKRILVGLLLLVVAGIAALAVTISYDSACEPAPAVADGVETMTAATYRCYGPPKVVQIGEVEKPTPGPGEVLVRVRRAAVNPLDWHYMRGSPYIMRLQSGIGAPTDTRLGVDFAGTVEAVGEGVTRFKPGDAVFGGGAGAFAEFLLKREDRALAHKPDNVSFDQAASVPIAAVTALQALRDKGQLQPGQKVLINGASGGVGTFAVQIAKAMGAEVTGVCSTRNVDMVRSLGADHVFDYKKENYIESGREYDLIVDMVGNHSPNANRRVLKPGGKLVLVGGAKGDWLGPLLGSLKAIVLQPFVDEELVVLLAILRGEDLETLAGMMEEGKLTVAIDRHYPLEQVSEALAYSEEGRARGKIVIDVE